MLHEHQWVTSLGPSESCAGLFGALYASGRDIQSTTGSTFGRESYVPLEGLCPRESAETDDRNGGRVSASLYAAYAPWLICSYTILQVHGKPPTDAITSNLQGINRSELRTGKNGDSPG